MKTYTLEELRLAQAKGCRIEYLDINIWTTLDYWDAWGSVSLERYRIHPADEWRARLPRLKEGAEWACEGDDNTSIDCRPYIVGELIEGMKSLRAIKGTGGRIDLPVPPEFLHPDELAKQPEVAVSADLMAMAQFAEREVLGAQATDFGEPWQPSCEMIFDRDGDYVAEFQPPFHDCSKVAARAIACVNALRGVPDPAKFVRQAKEMKVSIKEAHEMFTKFLAENDSELGIIDTSPTASCPICTQGITPAKFDKGPCSYHAALLALSKLKTFLP